MPATRSFSPNTIHPEAPTLIAAAPVLALHQELQRELAFVTERIPGSDLCRWLGDIESRMGGAITAATTRQVTLTSEEVASLINRTPARVRQLCEEGVFEYQRAGGTGPYQITKQSVDAFLTAKFARRAA